MSCEKKSSQTVLRTSACLVAGLLLVGVTPGAAKEKREVIERIEFVAIGKGHSGFAAGRASRLKLLVYRWTTPTERQEIIEVLSADDGPKVIADLEKRDVVGRLMIPGRSGVDLRYLWQVEQDGKTYVVGASERSLLSQPGRTTGTAAYYLAVLQLEFNEAGEGHGVLAPGIYPRFESNGTVRIASTISDPITLTKAVRETPKKKK